MSSTWEIAFQKKGRNIYWPAFWKTHTHTHTQCHKPTPGAIHVKVRWRRKKMDVVLPSVSKMDIRCAHLNDLSFHHLHGSNHMDDKDVEVCRCADCTGP